MTGYCDEGNGTGEKAIFDIIRFDLMEDLTLCLLVSSFGAITRLWARVSSCKGF